MTAHKMLSSFVDLKPGDWIVQNAANGSVNTCSIPSISMRSELQLGEIGGPSGGPVGQRSWNPHH